jgi:tellurite resistance protein
VLILMMLADGVVEEEEVVAIQEVYAKLANEELSRDRIDNEMHRARTDKTSLKDYLAEVASTLNDSGKELVIRAALMVAASDGDIAEEEQAMLIELGNALEIPPAHFNTILRGDLDA